MGQTFHVNDITIEVLGVSNPDILVNNFNNQSVVLKFIENNFSILFLADIGKEGGEKSLEINGTKIKSTAVQMAHHGQNGVNKDVYEQLNAKYAFWPTPKWLWDNTEYLGGTPGNGNFKTPEVIDWMNEIGTKNITSFEKTI